MLAGPKWLIVGRRIAINTFKRLCVTLKKGIVCCPFEWEGVWRPGQTDQAPGGCLVPGAPIIDSLMGSRRRSSFQLPDSHPARPKVPGLRTQLGSEDTGGRHLVHNLHSPILHSTQAISARPPGVWGELLRLGVSWSCPKPRDREGCIFFYCYFYPAFSQLIYEVGVSRGCSEWMGVGAPGHSLVEPPCWAAQQLRATQREPQEGAGMWEAGG